MGGIVLVIVCMLASCSTFNDDTDPFSSNEAVKDLSGTWKISAVTRNGVDIMAEMDFTQFSLNLSADGTYSINNYLPFVVRKDGTWKTDDPHYPFVLSFQESGAESPTEVELKYPISDGKRKLYISLSPGCYSNTYVYQMERVTNP